MSKQEDFVRTQVRLEQMTYDLLKQQVEKTGMSMNATINSLLHDALLDEIFGEDNLENKQLFMDIIMRRLETLNTKEVRDICSLVVMVSQLKGH